MNPDTGSTDHGRLSSDHPLARNPAGLVEDVGGLPPLLAIGTKRLCADYDGPALHAVNPVSGLGADIGFMASGELDITALRRLMQGASHLRVARLYDQRNGHHCVQAEPVHRPAISPQISLGGAIPIIFDGSKQGALTNRFLNIPASLATLHGQPVMQVAVAGFRDVAQSQGISTLSRQRENLTWGYHNSSDVFLGTVDTDRHATLPDPAPLTPFVAGFGNEAAGTMLWLDDACASFPHDHRAAIAGGTIGQLWNNNGGYVELCALMIFGREFTQADRALANVASRRHFGFNPHPGGVILCDGDSITEGYGGSLNQTWPKQMEKLLTRRYRIYNTGSFGQNSANRLAYLTPRWRKFFPRPEADNILVEFSGTNGLDQGVTSARIYADQAAIISGAQAAGAKVILATTLPRNGFSAAGNPPGQHETERLMLNDLIRRNAAGADGIADVAADPVMGSRDTLASTDYYFDRIHPATAGLGRIARIIAEAVNGLG